MSTAHKNRMDTTVTVVNVIETVTQQRIHPLYEQFPRVYSTSNTDSSSVSRKLFKGGLLFHGSMLECKSESSK